MVKREKGTETGEKRLGAVSDFVTAAFRFVFRSPLRPRCPLVRLASRKEANVGWGPGGVKSRAGRASPTTIHGICNGGLGVLEKEK